jgi:uncharacterized protein
MAHAASAACRSGDAGVGSRASETVGVSSAGRDDQLRSSQRWSPLAREALGSYVYMLVDPHTQRPFYIGKGVDDRCWHHLWWAAHPASAPAGEDLKLDTIRSLTADHSRVQVLVVRHGLTEREAFEVEAAVIDAMRWVHVELTNKVVGHDTARGLMSASEVEASHGARAVELDPLQRIVLVKIPKLYDRTRGSDALYEAARKWWRVGAHARDGATAVQWAFAVVDGVIRGCWRIDRWEAASADVVADRPELAGRWSFVGTEDRDQQARYVGGDVRALVRSSQNPVLYWPRPRDRRSSQRPGSTRRG